jgi:hypothetical protein
MARNGRLRPSGGIHPDVVIPTVVMKEAAVLSQMTLKLAPVHAER